MNLTRIRRSPFFRGVAVAAVTAGLMLASSSWARTTAQFVREPGTSFCGTQLGGKSIVPKLHPALFASSQLFNSANVGLWNLLTMLQNSGQLPFLKRKNLQALNLACGEGYESFTLASFFGSGKFLDPLSSGSSVHAMDIFGSSYPYRSLEVVQKVQSDLLTQNPVLGPLLNSVQYLKRDATLPQSYEGLPQKFDFIFVEHPEMYETTVDPRDPFYLIFKQALAHLNPDGILMTLVYSREDLASVKAALKQEGATFVTQGKHPYQEQIEDTWYVLWKAR